MKLRIKTPRKHIPSIISRMESSENDIKSYKETPRKALQNTRHAFGSEKENKEHIPSVAEHLQVPPGPELCSRSRVSIQNVLVSGSIEDDDKLSINNELEVFPRIPTKEFFFPSSNNIFGLKLPSDVRAGSNFNILF